MRRLLETLTNIDEDAVAYQARVESWLSQVEGIKILDKEPDGALILGNYFQGVIRLYVRFGKAFVFVSLEAVAGRNRSLLSQKYFSVSEDEKQGLRKLNAIVKAVKEMMNIVPRFEDSLIRISGD